MTKRLGDVLKKARALKGSTLREVEKSTDISNAYISQLESGGIEEPSPHKLKRLANFYKIEYFDLLEAAGYLTDKKRHSSVNTMLLTSKKLINALLVAREALEFYSEFAKPDNHQFIFDDEHCSRAEIYERYKQYSIGNVGVKAHEALEKIDMEVCINDFE